jgi:hypothetical protein
MAVITASPKNFVRLIELQETANQNLHTIKSLLETSRNVQVASLVENKRIDDDGDRLEKIEQETLDIAKEDLKIQKEQLQTIKEAEAERKKAQEEIQKVMDTMKTFKSPLERIKDTMKNLGGKFSGENIKTKVLESTNVLGINNKRLEKQKFIKEQTALGATGDLNKKFEGAYAAKKESSKVEGDIQKLRTATGGKFTDEELAKSKPENAALFAKKAALTEEYAQFDKGAQLKAGNNVSMLSPATQSSDKAPMVSPAAQEVAKTPTEAFASAGEQQEAAQENAKLMGDQTSLLQKIEENTRGGDSASGAKPAAEGGGGGLLGGLGKGLKSLGTGIGKGLGAILGGIGRGLFQLSAGLVALTPAIPVIGVLTLAAIGLGAALRLAAPAIEAFAPVLMKIAEVVGTVFVAAIEKIPEIIKSVGDVIMGVIGAISDSIIGIIDAVTGSIERLAQIDGGALLQVAGGLLALSGAMVAFGGAQALAGLGSLVGNLLTIGSDSPVEQLIKIGDRGEGIQKAADGMEKLGSAMGAFSKIDKKSMEAINDFPWLKATAFVAAGGSMQVDGAVVTKASKQNADAAAASSGGGGGNTAVVNAPVTTNNNTSQVIKSPIRNQESSMSRFIGSRFSRA